MRKGLIKDDDDFIPEYMPLVLRLDLSKDVADVERVRWVGSAFVVGPQMLFTAKHVVEQILAEDPALKNGKPTPIRYIVLQTRQKDKKNILWNIHGFGMKDNCDIALVTLSAAHEDAAAHLHWSGLPLTFIPPNVGDEVFASGIHKIDAECSIIGEEGLNINLDAKRSYSIGVVKEVHFESRDKAMYSFPCFQLDAQFDAGMSGGFVVNKKKEVCGIICGSLPAYTDSEEHISYASLLWPVVALPIPSQFIKSAESNSDYYLWDFYHQSSVKPIGIERVAFHNYLDTEGRIDVTYTDPAK